MILATGYQPARLRHVDKVAYAWAKEADVRRFSAPLRLADVKDASEWLEIKPTDKNSTGRVAIFDVAGSSKAVMSAMLKLVEEPPLDAKIVIVSESKQDLSVPLLSRCTIHDFEIPDYATVVADLAKRGMAPSNAARSAKLIQQGLQPDRVPPESEFSKAGALIDSAKARDFEFCAKIATTATSGTITALRFKVIEAIPTQEIGKVLAAMHAVSDPVSAAVLTAEAIARMPR